MDFSEALPEGLSVSRTEDGEDLEIKGVPSTTGTFEIDLAFSNGKRHAKEQHVFRIKDIGEPPFEFEKKIFIPTCADGRLREGVLGTGRIFKVLF